MKAKIRIALLPALAALSSSAFAIHVEPDQPDLQNPKTQLVESSRAAESIVNGGTTSISSSSFTSFNTTVKRKAFPPGYGRSGYQFEDELIGPATTEQTPDAAADAPADHRDAPSKP
jgi:hypothetical protein